jgi:carboxymethylenebutenolidase
MGEIVEFPSNGSTGHGYLARPTGTSGTGLGVLVIQEWWGLVPHIEDLCERFAAEGFVALAPDLYHGQTTTEPDEAGKLLMTLNLDRAAQDMSGAVDHLRANSDGDRIALTGFCMGGGLALLLATQRPDAFAAVAPFYGIIPWEAAQPDWTKLAAPLQGHYAENDEFASLDKVKQFEQELKDLGKDVEFHYYPGTHHAFFNDTRPEVHDPEAARQAWERTLAFFRRHLG